MIQTRPVISTGVQSTKGDYMTPDKAEDIGALIDQRRKLAAEIAGINLRIAMALGDRDAARAHLREMTAQTEARKAAQTALAQGVEHA